MFDDGKQQNVEVINGEVLGDDEDYDYSFSNREVLAQQFPGSVDELKRLAAATTIAPRRVTPSKTRRNPTFIKSPNTKSRIGVRRR